MATRHVEFLMRRQEFLGFLREVVSSMRLLIVEQPVYMGGTGSRGRVINIADVDGVPSRSQIYLTKESPAADVLAEMLPDSTARYGWVDVVLPYENDMTLTSAGFMPGGTGTTPFTRSDYDNMIGYELLTRIRKLLKPRLNRPVWTKHQNYTEVRETPDVWYTYGARDWVNQGGRLIDEHQTEWQYFLDPPPGLADEPRRRRAASESA